MDDPGSVLLVEDHRDLAEMVVGYFERRGYVMDYACDGLKGLRLACENHYDAIVLDLALPRIDGLEVCRRLRDEAHKCTPLLMLTARDTVQDRVVGLDRGADDYLVKPFDIVELEARVRALVRRERRQIAPHKLCVESLELDTGTLQVKREGHNLELTPAGLKLLTVLMRASPAVVARSELERALWGDAPPDTDALRSHMYVLRRTLDRGFSAPMLRTVKGHGYSLGGGRA